MARWASSSCRATYEMQVSNHQKIRILKFIEKNVARQLEDTLSFFLKIFILAVPALMYEVLKGRYVISHLCKRKWRAEYISG
jgi:hypothetical protein